MVWHLGAFKKDHRGPDHECSDRSTELTKMATTTVDEGEGYSQVTAVSGKKTEQYRKVQANLGNIVGTLTVNKGAKNSLCLKCEEKGWIDTAQDPPPKMLIDIILKRIELHVHTYDEFMAMLDSITGLDLVKKEIEKPCKQSDFSSFSCIPVSIQFMQL